MKFKSCKVVFVNGLGFDNGIMGGFVCELCVVEGWRVGDKKQEVSE